MTQLRRVYYGLRRSSGHVERKKRGTAVWPGRRRNEPKQNKEGTESKQCCQVAELIRGGKARSAIIAGNVRPCRLYAVQANVLVQGSCRRATRSGPAVTAGKMAGSMPGICSVGRCGSDQSRVVGSKNNSPGCSKGLCWKVASTARTIMPRGR